jgi:serine/threonine-protein kinase
MKKNSSLIGVSLLISIDFSLKAIAIPVPNVYINFAGAGGDFDSRTATFQVSDQTTTTRIGKNLRLYEAHLAKMLELTYNFCQDREPNYIVYWNYEADEGKVFMGEFPLSCQFARETFQTFGTGANETVTINYRGEPTQETIATLALNDKNSKQFASLIQTIKPQCIDTTPQICPGDRLE